MDRYVGVDAHAETCTFGVMGPSGRRLTAKVVETNGHALVEAVRSIPGRIHLCLEEGTQSAWLYEILSPFVQEIVVTAVFQSRGQKSDELDAFGLAEQLRTGAIKRSVFKEAGEFRKLRELGRAHSMVVRDVVRVQYQSPGRAEPGLQTYKASSPRRATRSAAVRP